MGPVGAADGRSYRELNQRFPGECRAHNPGFVSWWFRSCGSELLLAISALGTTDHRERKLAPTLYNLAFPLFPVFPVFVLNRKWFEEVT